MKKPDVVVRVGETMAVSPKTLLRLGRAEPIPESQDHYEVERWQIVEVEPACDECWGQETHFGQKRRNLSLRKHKQGAPMYYVKRTGSPDTRLYDDG